MLNCKCLPEKTWLEANILKVMPSVSKCPTVISQMQMPSKEKHTLPGLQTLPDANIYVLRDFAFVCFIFVRVQ